MLSIENSLVFSPAKPADEWHAKPCAEIQDVSLDTPDGRMNGWYCPAKKPKGAILMCHGKAGNLSVRGECIGELRDLFNCSILIFDYPGYGRSEGEPSEQGCYSAADAAYDCLVNEKRFQPEHILICGESLGGGVVVDLASRRPCAAVLLFNTFADLPSVAQRIYPWLPIVPLMHNRFDSVSKIGRIKSPIFITHAGADELITQADFQRLFAAVTAPKESMIRPSRKHEEPLSRSELLKVRNFLVHFRCLPTP